MMKVSSENECLMCSDEVWFVFVISTQTLSSLNKTRDDSKVLLSLSFSVKEVRDRRKYIKKLIHVQLKENYGETPWSIPYSFDDFGLGTRLSRDHGRSQSGQTPFDWLSTDRRVHRTQQLPLWCRGACVILRKYLYLKMRLTVTFKVRHENVTRIERTNASHSLAPDVRSQFGRM